MIKIKKEMAKKLGLELKSKSKTPRDRLLSTIEKVNRSSDKDYFKYDSANDYCVLHFEDIGLLSLNDLLRNDNRSVYKLKKAWHKRVLNLIKGEDINSWNPSLESVIEFVYRPKTGHFMDADSISASIKSTLDGIVLSKLLDDDNPSNLPLIIPKQEKQDSLKKYSTLTIMISQRNNIEKFYTEKFKSLIMP